MRFGASLDLSKLVNSDHYQDYVFKDGEFVGQFDEMYRRFSDPWLCVEDSTSLENDIFCTLLRWISQDVNSVLDVGCGLGALTARIRAALRPSEISAIDVSSDAIEKAKKTYPGIQFGVRDLISDNLGPLPHDLDLITMAEVGWYIIPGIEKVLTGFHRLLRPDGHLVVLQHFLRPEDQKYGREVMQAPGDLSDLITSAGFRIESEIHTQPKPPMKALIWARKS